MLIEANINENISKTSGFWPRVRARALRAPVFLDSLQRQTGRCAPPAHRSFAASCSIPKIDLKLLNSYSGRPRHGLFSFHRTTEAKYEVPCPRTANRSFADPSGDRRKKGFIFMLAKHI